MFESALVEHKLGKEEYEHAEPELRTRLVEAQLELSSAGRSPWSSSSAVWTGRARRR